MKLPKTMFTALCALIFCSPAVQAGGNAPPGFEPLFNGKDFSGWHGMGHFDPRKLVEMSEEQRNSKTGGRSGEPQTALDHRGR